MARTRVVVDSRFRQLGAELERGVERALGQAAGVAVAAAREAETDVRTGKLRGSIRASTVYETTRGKEIEIYVPANVFYGRFIEYGTLGKRGRKVKRADKRSRATHTQAGKKQGVKAVHFLLKGRRAALYRIVGLLERELR